MSVYKHETNSNVEHKSFVHSLPPLQSQLAKQQLASFSCTTHVLATTHSAAW
jgi:hypothetical protein